MAVKKIYYSMGEVAEMFDVNQSLIRHWESKFDCLKPHKNAKGNRMFTEADVERLKQIYHLVKERGMTLKGAAKVLRQSSQDELKREMELLERLQKVRSLLVEVREELKAGDGAKVLARRCVRERQELAEAVLRDYQAWYETTGNGFPAELYSLFKIMWYQKHCQMKKIQNCTKNI